jgi:hypothetical protein
MPGVTGAGVAFGGSIVQTSAALLLIYRYTYKKAPDSYVYRSWSQPIFCRPPLEGLYC